LGQAKKKRGAEAPLWYYFITISPPRDSGRLIITIPTLLLGMFNFQFTSGVDSLALSAILWGI